MILLAAAIAVCPPGPRDNCVVDGDTLWHNGEKVRIANIDTPELHRPKCPQEALQAREARDRLVTLLRPGFTLQRAGNDRYGRTLARVSVNGRDIGQQLVSEGLARKWTGRREPWC